MSGRLLVIGLDCAAPRFIFGPDAFDLPNLQRLMSCGVWGRLQSCHPPITVPAWAVMTTGKDPGELGVYGFRVRGDRGYGEGRIASALDIRQPRIWDTLSSAGKRVAIVGVPQTYPPSPVNGCMVSGFPMPDRDASYTYPAELQIELEREIGAYIPDVHEFRTEDKAGLLARIHEHMENKFAIARYVMRKERWNFFMMVELGLDRLHHGFWKYCDPDHPLYDANNPYTRVFEDYYRRLDERIGELVAFMGEDAAVMVVSDHGAKALHGTVATNEWLMREGYLCLKSAPSAVGPLRMENVDWSKTRAWGVGGYCGRIEINLAGREPEGIVLPTEYESLRRELAASIESMRGPEGTVMGNRAVKPESIYRTVCGIAPDLIVYFGDLDWRAAGTVGHGKVFLRGNDTGPDECNHDFEGVFIAAGLDNSETGEADGVNIADIAPMIARFFGQREPTAR